MLTNLTPTERVLYMIIADAVSGGETTPDTRMMQAALAQRGHRVTQEKVGEGVRQLTRAGLIRPGLIGGFRVYRLPDADRHTKPRCVDQMPDAQSRQAARDQARAEASSILTGWPRPTPESIAAYDAAMARRPYAPVARPAQSDPVPPADVTTMPISTVVPPADSRQARRRRGTLQCRP